jgi:recombination associated protein RdgC
MWFKNMQLYRVAPGRLENINANLERYQLTPCGALDRYRIGWTKVHDDLYAYGQDGQVLIAMGINEKVLPASVVKKYTEEQIALVSEQEGYRPGSKRRKEIREQVEDELLPRAFEKTTVIQVWIDTVNGWLAINTSSASKAESLLNLLFDSAPDLHVKLTTTKLTPGLAMTYWLANNDVPDAFTIDRYGELRHPGEDRATVRYVHHALDGQDIGEHIANGKQVIKLGLTWNDRISFVLTNRLEIKRIQFLDIIREQPEQAEDADDLFQIEFAVMTGELSRLISDVVLALGGETEE